MNKPVSQSRSILWGVGLMQRLKSYFYLLVISYSIITQSAAKDLIQESQLQLFDVGLAHINGDEYYDIYTANHGYSESLLLNNKGSFQSLSFHLNNKMVRDSETQEMNGSIPPFKTGLNIFRTDNSRIFLYCNKCDHPIKGKIIIPKAFSGESANSIEYEENAKASIKEYHKDGDYDQIDFTLEETSLLVLNRKYVSVAVHFEIDYKTIYLGPNQESPNDTKFSLISFDNHTFAWTRLNNDHSADVFVGAGGLKGKIQKFESPQVLNDMLLISKSNNDYQDIYSQVGLKKYSCRGYSSMWIDIDSDNDLDLYIGCENDANQLFIQNENGNFSEKAKDYGLDFKHGSVFKWQDWNQDGFADILVIQQNKLSLLLNQVKDGNNKFKVIKTSKPLGRFLQAVNTNINVADINNDNTLDVFVTTAKNQYYFVQESLSFKKKNMSSIGLPNNLRGHLNIVDVNLDGLLDICLYEQGVYLQGQNGKFTKSEILKDSFKIKSIHHEFDNGKNILWFRSYIWFDKENNGSWDVLESGTYRSQGSYEDRLNKRRFKVLSFDFLRPHIGSKVHLHEEIPRENNWLQIELTGTRKNLDAIGAKVTVQTGDLNQYRYTYGASDTFHSQGHYRHYFGLKQNKMATVIVTWPDGKKSTYKDVGANQLLKINYTD